MSHIERRNDEPMPKEPTPRGADPAPENELARRAPEELMPISEPDDQPMSTSALAPDNAVLARRARSPPANELARRVPEELMPSGVPEPDDQPTDLAGRARTPLFLPDSRGPTPFAFSQSNFDHFRPPTPILSRVPPEVDVSRKRARSNSVEPPPSKRRKAAFSCSFPRLGGRGRRRQRR
jgi:hypothetical protein